MTVVDIATLPRPVRERADDLLAQKLHDTRVRTDRIFRRLFAAQWLFALVIAFFSSPYSWEGSAASVHIHVVYALVIGGALTIGPTLLITAMPGHVVTRHLVTVSQMLWSALLIHLTGGRIETHFHVFGSLAFLAFYRDWRVLPTATVVVAADHLARGLLQPESVYGIANPEWWRFLEHASWVAFEDIVLVLGTIVGVSEMRTSAVSQARVEAMNAGIERIVDDRTRELQSSREQYRELLEGSRAVPWVFDRNARRFTYIGPHIEVITGFPAALWLEPGFFGAHVHDDDRETLAAIATSQPMGGEAEYRLLDSRGKSVFVRTTYTRRGDDELVRGILVDITERRAMERDLQQAQKLSAIGSLAAGVAHEINTPIQYVNDNTEFLERAFTKLLAMADDKATTTTRAPAKLAYLKSEVPKALADSLDGLRRVTTIVRAMKEFSHPSNGQKVSMKLKENLETTATISRNEWKYCADLDIDIDDEMPAVPALRDELNQVFLNLIVNAAHAIEEKNAGTDNRGTITIRAFVDGGFAEVRVTDDGAGIEERVKARIFEPFFTTKAIGKGTGQGLAIASSVVVQKHGGSITCESKRGVGTTFVIRLPLVVRADDAVAA